MTGQISNEKTNLNSKEYESFFNLEFSGNAVINRDSDWLLVNNRLCDIFCVSREDIHEIKWYDLVSEDNRRDDVNIFEQVINGAISNVLFETRITRLDGIEITVNISMSALSPEPGENRIALQVVDITGVKLTEDTLRRNEIMARRSLEELEWIYSNAPIGLCHLDLDMKYKRINRFLSDLNGLHPNSHIGKKIRDIIPEIKDSMEQVKQEIIATGRPYAREFRREGNHKDNDIRYFDEIWYPLYDEYRTIIGFGAVVEEITEKKHVLALKAADRRKNELLATLAHELRNPIGSVSAALELMRIIDETDTISPTRDRVPLERAERQIRHMKQLVEDILTVTRINQGKIELRLEQIDIYILIQQVAETFHQRIKDKKLNFILDNYLESPIMMLDPLRITQVISNLLDNAIKYTELEGKISITLKREGADIVIIIRDNGIGIPHKNLNVIFEIFNQIQTAPDKKNEGIGIGLALVRNLVELHGGKVEARSDGIGRGATFIVRIPNNHP